MTETIVEVRVPSPLLQLGFDRDDIRRRVVEWLVLSLFTEGRISSGKAAHLLNLTRVEFPALLRALGVAYVNYSADELTEEFEATHRMRNVAEGIEKAAEQMRKKATKS